jgi:hypothetical protein
MVAAVIERPRPRRHENDGKEALGRIESHEEVCKIPLRDDHVSDRGSEEGRVLGRRRAHHRHGGDDCGAADEGAALMSAELQHLPTAAPPDPSKATPGTGPGATFLRFPLERVRPPDAPLPVAGQPLPPHSEPSADFRRSRLLRPAEQDAILVHQIAALVTERKAEHAGHRCIGIFREQRSRGSARAVTPVWPSGT